MPRPTKLDECPSHAAPKGHATPKGRVASKGGAPKGCGAPKGRPARTRPRSRRIPTASLLGEDFSVGVATSGYQVEGGFNGNGEPHDDWSDWENTGRVARSGVACDFWRHPEESLDRAAALGCNAFRLSVEWARLEPAPGPLRRRCARALRRDPLAVCGRGMEPMVTLHHFTHPWWLGEEFWLRPGSPDVFARHVARVVPALAPHCRRWVTVNEPNVVMLMGWIEGACPPGRRMAVSDAFCVLDNLLTAHVLAADAVAAVQAGAEVTINTSSSSVYELDRMLVDLLGLQATGVDPSDVDGYVDERRAVHDAAFPPRHAGEAVIRRFFAAVSPYGTVREPGRGPAWARLAASLAAARRAAWSPPCMRRCGAARSMRSASTGTTPSPVTPSASRGAGGTTAGTTGPSGAPCGTWSHIPRPCARGAPPRRPCDPGFPCGSSRTGCPRRCGTGARSPTADGVERPRYVREHLGAVADVVAAGIPLHAYLHWSLADNYEWGSYEPRFGLYGMDRSDPSAPCWMDTDAQGDDAAGEFARVLAGLRAGDRSVTDPPA